MTDRVSRAGEGENKKNNWVEFRREAGLRVEKKQVVERWRVTYEGIANIYIRRWHQVARSQCRDLK